MRRLICTLASHALGYCADALQRLSKAIEPPSSHASTAPAREVGYGRTHQYDYSQTPQRCVFCGKPRRLSMVVEECHVRRFR
jgi:hypothetical protein